MQWWDEHRSRFLGAAGCFGLMALVLAGARPHFCFYIRSPNILITIGWDDGVVSRFGIPN